MIIRTLTGADSSAFKAIRVQATIEAPMTVHPTSEEESARPLKDFEIVLSDATDRVFGAFEDESLIGITGLFREPGAKRMHLARIRFVYVRPEHRGRGIARQLLAAAVDYGATLPGIRQIKLAVHTDNPTAQRLYADAGFQIYATETDALRIDGKSVDEYLMRLQLA